MNLTKLQYDTISQMVSNDNISLNLSEKFKKKIIKTGVVAVLAVTAFFSSGFAHADNALAVTSGLGALTGVLINGAKPSDIPADCNVQGTNGWKVGGAAVAGGYALNKIGAGKGKVAATVLGGFMAATVAQNLENGRIRKECFKQKADKERQQGYANSNAAYPSNNYNAQAPQAMILYAVKDANGVPIYVTVNDSPGLASLKGQSKNKLDPENDAIVKNALDKSLFNMMQAHDNLDASAKGFERLRGTASKLSRYAVNEDEIRVGRSASNEQREGVEKEHKKFIESFNNYAKERSVFAQIADNAATDGFSLTGYAHAVEMMLTPPSVQVAYDGQNVNRYKTFVIKSTSK